MRRTGSIRILVGLLATAAALMAQAPARIVSTFPSITETLFALGAGTRVVGVSNYCRFPPAVLALPKVGSFTKPDPEKIVRLNPDLVIIDQSAAVLAGQLSALGIRTAAVKVGSLADVYGMIRDIGAAVALPGEAARLNTDIEAKLAAARAQTRGGARPTVLMLIGRDPGGLTNLTAVGPSAYLGELLEIAGGSNVMAGTALAYPRISLETVVRLNPDVILDASVMGDANADAPAQAARLRQPWLARRELKAARTGRIFGLTSEALSTPGPRVVDAVELLRTALLEKGTPP